MKKIVLTLAVCIGATAGLFAQSNDKTTAHEPTAEEKAWIAYMTPGPMHEMLSRSNGEWNEEMTMWMAPGAPAQKNTASCVNRMIMGGRYQESNHTGNFNGMPFMGTSTVGYDNATKKFVSTWIDNMGTGIMYMEGIWNDQTKAITFTGSMVDPISGKTLPARETFRIVDDNTHMMEMYSTTPEGKEYKTMEIKFTRK